MSVIRSVRSARNPNLELLEKALRDEKFRKLNDELQDYIKHYITKVLVSTGTVEEYSRDIEKKTVKFSQTWDVISRTKEGYKHYVTETFYPCLRNWQGFCRCGSGGNRACPVALHPWRFPLPSCHQQGTNPTIGHDRIQPKQTLAGLAIKPLNWFAGWVVKGPSFALCH